MRATGAAACVSEGHEAAGAQDAGRLPRGQQVRGRPGDAGRESRVRSIHRAHGQRELQWAGSARAYHLCRPLDPTSRMQEGVRPVVLLIPKSGNPGFGYRSTCATVGMPGPHLAQLGHHLRCGHRLVKRQPAAAALQDEGNQVFVADHLRACAAGRGNKGGVLVCRRLQPHEGREAGVCDWPGWHTSSPANKPGRSACRLHAVAERPPASHACCSAPHFARPVHPAAPDAAHPLPAPPRHASLSHVPHLHPAPAAPRRPWQTRRPAPSGQCRGAVSPPHAPSVRQQERHRERQPAGRGGPGPGPGPHADRLRVPPAHAAQPLALALAHPCALALPTCLQPSTATHTPGRRAAGRFQGTSTAQCSHQTWLEPATAQS